MSLISVIVPVYNSEQYLDRCLSSIQNQTYENLEVIIIDDGSSDNSRQVCEQYVCNDSRFRYFYQKNAGVSAARNNGLSQCAGEYIAFVDSDDYISKEHIENLYVALTGNDADLSVCGFQIFDGNKNETFISKMNGGISKEQLSYAYLGGETVIWNSPCNKLYKRNLINSKFDTSMKCGEDAVFNMEYFRNINNVVVLSSTSYFYYVPVKRFNKYPDNDAEQCYKYCFSVKNFIEKHLEKNDCELLLNQFICGCVCRDAGLIAKGKTFSEANNKIREFFDFQLLSAAISSKAWQNLGIKYRIMGSLLFRKRIATIICISKLS